MAKAEIRHVFVYQKKEKQIEFPYFKYKELVEIKVNLWLCLTC